MNVRNYIREFNPTIDLLSNNMLVGVFGEHLNVDDPYSERFYIGYIVNDSRDNGIYGIEFTEDVNGNSLKGLAALERGFNVKENNIYILKPGIDWVNYQSEQSVPKMAESASGIQAYFTSPPKAGAIPNGTLVIVNGKNLGLNNDENYLGVVNTSPKLNQGLLTDIVISFSKNVGGPGFGYVQAVNKKYVEIVDDSLLDEKDDKYAQIDEILEQEDAEENNRPRETPNEVLSTWYKSNTKKINRLSPEKKDSVENAVLFLLKRYSQQEPIATQIEQDDFSFLENFDPEIAIFSEIEEFDLENLEL